MQAFEDNKNRTWNFNITVASVKRVRSELNLELTNLGEDGFVAKITNDPELMVDMFWVLLEDQAKKMVWKNDAGEMVTGVDTICFAEGVAGDVIDDALKAFEHGLANFFPKAKREVTSLFFAKKNKIVDKGFQKIESQIEAEYNDEKIDQMIDEIFDKKTS